jgi:hypothetical protein
MIPKPFETHPLCAPRPSSKKKKLHHMLEDALVAHLGLDLCRKDAKKRREGVQARILSDQPTDLHEDTPERIALFAHYNPQHRVSDMVLSYLDQLRAQGFAIQFISITPICDAQDHDALASRVSRITIRREFGRDLGAWQDLWQREAHRFSKAKEVLLANDSVLGPLCDISPILQAMRRAPEGLVGLTDTPLIEPHLQSYFLLIRGRAGVQVLDQFFDQLLTTDKKTRLIRRGELAISRYFRDHGLSVRCVFSYDRLEEALLANPERIRDLLRHVPGLLPDGLARFDNGAGPALMQDLRPALARHSHNPSLLYWRTLLEEMGFPFIKTELLRNNPDRVQDLDNWPETIAQCSPDMAPVVLTHLGDMQIATPA